MHRFSLILLLLAAPFFAAAGDEWELYSKGRGHYFNEEWLDALKYFNQLVNEYPQSPRRCKVETYVGYCFEKLGDKQNAFDAFSKIVAGGNCKADIVNDAKAERLQLAYKLAEVDKSMVEVLKEALKDPNLDLRFSAALWLVQLKNNAGLEVFFEVVEKDTDQDRRDTAFRHIMQIGSDADRARLQEITQSRKTEHKVPKMIKLTIRNVATNVVEQKVQVPIKMFSVLINTLEKEHVAQIKESTGLDLNDFNIDLEKIPSGKVLFQIVDENGREIKVFLE